jgi:hypothetical protein
MNRNDLTLDDNGTGKMQQCQIIALLLFIPYHQFPEPVQLGMAYLNYPPPRLELRVPLLFLPLFPTPAYMRRIPHRLCQRFCPGISRIKAQAAPLRAGGNNGLHRRFQ